MLKKLLCGVLVSGMWMFHSVMAQEPVITEYQDWIGVCAEVAGQERCEIQQTLNVENEQGLSRLMRATVSLMDGQRVMQFLLPLGLDLRPGIVMQIDEGEEFKSGFLTCVQEGCLVAFPLDDSRLQQMRAGKALKLGFRPFNTDQTLVIEASLMGFTRASNSIK